MSKILIIDDERGIRNTLKEILADEGHEVEVAENGKQGLEMAQAKAYDLIFSDIKMPEMDGMELLTALREAEIDCPVVMISGHGTIETAVECIKKGAFDFVEKPPDLPTRGGDRSDWCVHRHDLWSWGCGDGSTSAESRCV